MEVWNSLCDDIVATGDNLLAGLEVAEELHSLHSGYHHEGLLNYCEYFGKFRRQLYRISTFNMMHGRSLHLVPAPLDDGVVLHHHHGAHGPVLLPAHAALQQRDVDRG